MIDMFKRWWLRPARWYQFWYPQSGLFGGLMCGIVLAIVFYITQP
jgi:hypothetical protein